MSSKQPPAPSAASDLLSPGEWDAITASLQLSGKELEVCRLIFDGLTELAISHRLEVSIHTV
ncbi:MAG TPA: hypothetical protein VIY86_14680, partial [Pirellulaceae bacterium]